MYICACMHACMYIFMYVRMFVYVCIYVHAGIKVRLVGGSSQNEGRVEVNYNGEWGTVCDDGWDDTEAGVVCRQLGFGSSGIAIGSAGFGQGSGSIWLVNVTCVGSESTLASCGHPGVNITQFCNHSEDAGVKCTERQGTYYDQLSMYYIQTTYIFCVWFCLFHKACKLVKAAVWYKQAKKGTRKQSTTKMHATGMVSLSQKARK